MGDHKWRDALKMCGRQQAFQMEGRSACQQMALFPRFRLEMTPKPFTNSAMKCCRTILHYSRQANPRHPYMASTLETDAFLKAFTRILYDMVTWRGWPKMMISHKELAWWGTWIARKSREWFPFLLPASSIALWRNVWEHDQSSQKSFFTEF